MKVVIVGPGAMGCLFAGFLSISGQDVWFLDKNKERAGELEKTGLKVEGISGQHQAKVKATVDPGRIGLAELVIICVKSYDTATAVENAISIVGENTVVLTLQNGLGNAEIISQRVGEEKTIAGVSSEGATLLGTGHIRHAGRGPTIIGWMGKKANELNKDNKGKKDSKQPYELTGDDKSKAVLKQIVDILTRAGFEARAADNVEELIWSKLIINVGINALTAITRLNNGRLIEFEGTKSIMYQAVREALAVVSSKGITLTYPEPIVRVEEVCRATATNVSSMLQDVLKKKRTEIDAINGAIVREAKKLGLSVPVNATLTNLVKTIENSYSLQVG